MQKKNGNVRYKTQPITSSRGGVNKRIHVIGINIEWLVAGT